MDWTKAKQHFDEVYSEYEQHLMNPRVNVTFAIHAVLNPIKERYDRGERTEDLFNCMMAVE